MAASSTRPEARPATPAKPVVATKAWSGDAAADVQAAGSALAGGKLVAFPTETVYGLGANAFDDAAVRGIFEAKGRPADNPLIVHIPSRDALASARLTAMPLGRVARAITDAFWPGPLTVVLPCLPGSRLSQLVTAGLDSVGVRVPDHAVARALLHAAGVPVAAPSANLSGRPSPTEAHHVHADLDGRIFGVVEDVRERSRHASSAGDAANPGASWAVCGVESTVVDLTNEERPVILRPGAVSLTELERASGVQFGVAAPLVAAGADGRAERQRGTAGEAAGGADATGARQGGGRGAAPRAPGMKYRHYAPVSPVVLCEDGDAAGAVERAAEREAGRAAGRRAGAPLPVGLLADAETCGEVGAAVGAGRVACVACGRRGDAASFARGLYAALRAFDGEGEHAVPAPGVCVIVAVAVRERDGDISAAVMNRLRKAACGA